MLRPGTVVDDKYRLERVLGRGGMGLVIEARHVQLGALVALKFLHQGIVGNQIVIERFLREARATAAMTNEHVCRVFDVGVFQGVPYLAMERLEGIDLAKLLQHRPRLPVHEACDYVIQVCAGLAEAHAAKIVHRDLKPGNLFLTSRVDGTPLIKVLDFGIAKAPQDGDGDHELTGIHTVLGSPQYMSLEQLRSSKLVDARSDIWSLGVLLFQMVSGRRPFVGDGIADLVLKIATEPTPRLPEGPAALDQIIMGCLARDPAQRYQDVAALARALAPLAGGPDYVARGAAWNSSPSGVLAPGQREQKKSDPITTLSSGVIETPVPLRGSSTRASVIGVLVAGTVVGTLLAIAVTRGDVVHSASPQHEPVAPADVAPRPPLPPAPGPAAVFTPTFALDAAVIAPLVDPAPTAEAAAAVPDKPAVPRAAPRPKPRPPKPSTAELGKSRI